MISDSSYELLDLSLRSSVLFVHTYEQAGRHAKSQHVKHVVVIIDDGEAVPEGTINLESLRHDDSIPMKTIEVEHRETTSHPFLLPYSFGTTGLPKGRA
jgi:acyl-coenzyme A synthetase/AMP-(fatty) acid ligase